MTRGGEVRLRLAVSGAGIPSAVRLVYMEDGKGEVRKDMPYILMSRPLHIFGERENA